jgi:hypothetical protein
VVVGQLNHAYHSSLLEITQVVPQTQGDSKVGGHLAGRKISQHPAVFGLPVQSIYISNTRRPAVCSGCQCEYKQPLRCRTDDRASYQALS